ncbi:MAG: helix-turn-helix transcriptional regulator [Bdellovibrionales bacterium]|jgi:transcriptional regulator with XRE-family HTH domain|nr:helix-turn-helix transcriptional regulator [Bdellovibrionales bacterium]MBT3524707.1 helix-turn-helix transcriptional regulator [Bdellovibrionales bacterium]MBT7766371.1 helix-turn-helix transcriptional regulator [Bdellovibrionales bacterium]
MPKRSRVKEISRESEALKRMRLICGLSQREAADRIGVTPTMVNHTENGRAYIKRDYIKLFISALDYS